MNMKLLILALLLTACAAERCPRHIEHCKEVLVWR
jgi:hypothetical protein